MPDVRIYILRRGVVLPVGDSCRSEVYVKLQNIFGAPKFRQHEIATFLVEQTLKYFMERGVCSTVEFSTQKIAALSNTAFILRICLFILSNVLLSKTYKAFNVELQ